jgi:Arc/MetJ-type ribon-helix-helix transcriptional regulator
MAGKTKTVSLSLAQEMYNQMEQCAEQMEVSKSELLRRALDLFLASELRWQQIREWGEETSERLNIKDESDVDKIIHELRKEKSEYKVNKKNKRIENCKAIWR